MNRVLAMFGYINVTFDYINRSTCRLYVHQIQMLQGQVGSYQQEMDEVDLVKSDWMMEKEALEAVLVKLRSRLRAKEEALAVKTQEVN